MHPNNKPPATVAMRLMLLFFTGLIFQTTVSAYRIAGTINGNTGCYHPRVYLAVIDHINGFYHADDKNIIAKADIDSSGGFLMEGIDLPAEPLFYRLYFTPEEHASALVRGGSGRNFIILLLHQQSDIRITIPELCAPFFSYRMEGSPDSEALHQVQQLTDEYFRLYPEKEGETKKQFYINAYHQRLLGFADSSHSAFAGLKAIMETGVAENYTVYNKTYQSFASAFIKAYPSSPYGKQLEDLLEVESFKNQTRDPGSGTSLVIKLLIAALVFSSALNIYLYIARKKSPNSINTVSETENSLENPELLIQQLTIREREILLMIDQGLSNKEIADKLNIEVSTIKTHVSRIYQKINIRSRKEVRQIARFLS